MNNDHLISSGYCPKAKKSKPSEENEDSYSFSNWAYLPSVVVHNVFEFLNRENQLNASSVCRNWRQNVFHPKWWPSITFQIEGNAKRAQFLTSTFGGIVVDATIKVNILSPTCIDEFYLLIDILRDNNNLRALMLEPTHCHFDSCDIVNVVDILKECLPKLSKFSIGCIEEFSHYLDEYLEILSAKKTSSKVTHLGLASVKDVPGQYEASYFDPNLIIPFTNLKVLSIDYDQLTDNFLSCLNKCNSLERLVVHLHGIRNRHPGTTNAAWLDFKHAHPKCSLRLTVIHAFHEIVLLHKKVLRKHMPLTHLKVFFCEHVNMAVLEFLTAFYSQTLQSLVWVDSISKSKRTWSLTKHPYDSNPDPLIMVAWLCKKLEELVLYGYKYYEENLIGIASLREDSLKKFEIAEEDIVFRSQFATTRPNYFVEIQNKLKKPWAPMKAADLHPVLHDPTLGDSDEYLLPIVLADLH